MHIHTRQAPRGRRQPAELADGNRRGELLRGAARLFRRKGFNATSTRDIAAAVGMQSGSPFYHFKSKGALLYAVMEEGMRSAIARQQQALQAATGRCLLQKKEQGSAGPRALLAVLVRNHFDILLGPGSDFIPVMLYEPVPSPAPAQLLSARKRVRGRGFRCWALHGQRPRADVLWPCC